MMIFHRKPEEFIDKLLGQIGEFSKVAESSSTHNNQWSYHIPVITKLGRKYIIQNINKAITIRLLGIHVIKLA